MNDFAQKENEYDEIRIFKSIAKSLLLILKRYIHLKWIQELFNTWLSFSDHERLNLYKICHVICMAHMIVINIHNSLKDLILAGNTIQTIKDMT